MDKKEKGYYSQVAKKTLDETVSSGFLPFVLSGFAEALDTIISFVGKPRKTLNLLEKKAHSQRIMISCVSLFITTFWLCDKYIFYLGHNSSRWLKKKWAEGTISDETFVLPVAELYEFTTNISAEFTKLEVTISFVIFPMIFAIAISARKSNATGFVQPRQYIRPTITFIACYGFIFVVSNTLNLIFKLIGNFYFLYSFIIVTAISIITIGWAIYAIISWCRWAASIFDISAWKMFGYYLLTYCLFGGCLVLIWILTVIVPSFALNEIFTGGANPSH